MPQDNLQAVSWVITDAAEAGVKILFLPETSDFITENAEAASLTKPLYQSGFVRGVRAQARETRVWISVTVHESVRTLP